MSFILKALKKLEEEKAAQRIRPQDIQSAILTGESAATKGHRRYMKPMAILLVFIAGSGLTYFVLRQSPAPSAMAQHPATEKESRDPQPRQPQVTTLPPAAPLNPPEKTAAAEQTSVERSPAPPAKVLADPQPAPRTAATSPSHRDG
ncbi:MAG TPA: hypothetical protein VK187_14405, partial [Geobacteraceae bacterium]|nr:hypothetical protein [Geobacteraceae bacterium]